MPKKEILTIYHIELTKITSGFSGGDMCMAELIKRFAKIENVTNIFYTTANNIAFSKKFFGHDANIQYREIGNYKYKISNVRMISFFIFLTFKSFFHLTGFKTKNNVIISHSSFFPTVIFAYLLRSINKDTKWFSINHMFMPNPFKGFKFQFVPGKFIMPSFVNIYHWLNERLYLLLVKKADLSISVNSSYLSFLKKYNKNILIIKYDIEKIGFNLDMQVEKIYDAYFLGRFHEQKGIFELVDIIDRVKRRLKKDFKCAMIGDYNCPIGKEFIDTIKKKGLGENFIFFGSKTGKEKYEIISRSKIFLFPSYYESFGIVYLEAISMGIPTIEYDLPIYTDHKHGSLKVPFLNNKIFADKIIELLSDEAVYARISAEGIEYAKEFSWDKTAEVILARINNDINA